MVNFSRRGVLATGIALSVGAPLRARAEMSQVRVATQIGFGYLPYIVMEHDKLWEDEARKLGVQVSVEYARLGGGAALNDALLSGNAQVVSAGIAPLLTVWDKTAKNLKVKMVSSMCENPLMLLTNRPEIKSVTDFTDNDKIAVASIRVSINAMVVAMALERALGPGNANKLDNIQVTMSHPEAFASLTQRSGGITGYVSASPFQDRALKMPGVSKVTDSFEAAGGPMSNAVNYALSSFVEENPKLVQAKLAAQRRAIEHIKAEPQAAIAKYLAVTGDKTDPALLDEILKTSMTFDLAPRASLAVADFMARSGMLKNKPESWKDYCFPQIHDLSGS